MINRIDAAKIINKELPGYQIQKQMSYNNFFIFLVAPSNLEEPPTFFKVEKTTGECTDFSPWNEPDPEAFEEAFLA